MSRQNPRKSPVQARSTATVDAIYEAAIMEKDQIAPVLPVRL